MEAKRLWDEISSVERIKWLTPTSISSKTILQKNKREILRFREQNWESSLLAQNTLNGSPSGWNERTLDDNSNPHEQKSTLVRVTTWINIEVNINIPYLAVPPFIPYDFKDNYIKQ